MKILDELERLEKDLPQAPWWQDGRDPQGFVMIHSPMPDSADENDWVASVNELDSTSTAEAIIAARNALPTLIALLKEARELAEQATDDQCGRPSIALRGERLLAKLDAL